MGALDPRGVWELAEAVGGARQPASATVAATVLRTDQDGTVWVRIP